MVSSALFCGHCGAANPAQGKFCFACGQALHKAAQGDVEANEQGEENGRLKPGELLRGRYKVLRQIGQGGFGAVYKAEDGELGQRLVAVKEMSEHGLSPREIEEGVAAFKREALMLAGLMHKHLPRIYDHFEEHGRWYLVMDYIEGETLEEHFNRARDGSLPLVMAMKIALQLCDVLEYLHTRQPPIIFRDLKPANIILTPKGDIFLIDFGIARHFKPGQARDTIAFGSPGYAAPEQYGKAQTTPRADIYSLGAILHQMLSGKDPSLSPFRFPPLAGHDPALQHLIASMLAMGEEQRPATIGMVKQTLEGLRDQPAQVSSLTVLRQGQSAPALPTTNRLPAVQSLPAPLMVYEHHYGVVRAVAWSPDSTFVASATEAIVRVWNPSTGKQRSSYREHLGMLKHMVWSPVDMRIASVSEENRVRVWESLSGKTVSVYPGDPKPGLRQNRAHVLAWSADGRYLAVGGSLYIDIWDTREHQTMTRLRNKISTGTRALSWSPTGESLAAVQGNAVLIYRLKTRPSISYYRYGLPMLAVAWSPNGNYLASGGYDHAVHVWDVHTDQLVATYQNHAGPVSALAWSPDCRRIVSGALAASINIWDALTGWGVLSYPGHAGNVLALAWSPDGRAILSGGSDCKVCIWRAP